MPYGSRVVVDVSFEYRMLSGGLWAITRRDDADLTRIVGREVLPPLVYLPQRLTRELYQILVDHHYKPNKMDEQDNPCDGGITTVPCYCVEIKALLLPQPALTSKPESALVGV
jgi:hypothetical protein